MGWNKDVQWTLDELKSEREALAEELAEVNARHAPAINELLQRLEDDVREAVADAAHQAEAPAAAQPAKAKRTRKPKAEPDAFTDDEGNALRRAEAKLKGWATYANKDDEGVVVGRCVDCDEPAGTPATGCGNPMAHRVTKAAPAAGELPL